MKYYKLNNEVFAFSNDQLDYVKPEMVEMTADEIDRHLNPQNYLTDEEKRAAYLASFPPLTKRQFSLYLYDIGKYDEVMNALNANPRFKIEFESVATIERLSSTVAAMGQILEWDAETVDNHWKEALKL